MKNYVIVNISRVGSLRTVAARKACRTLSLQIRSAATGMTRLHEDFVLLTQPTLFGPIVMRKIFAQDFTAEPKLTLRIIWRNDSRHACQRFFCFAAIMCCHHEETERTECALEFSPCSSAANRRRPGPSLPVEPWRPQTQSQILEPVSWDVQNE